MTSLGGVVEQLIKSNNAINIYEEYFPDAPPAPGSDAPGKPDSTYSLSPTACRSIAPRMQYGFKLYPQLTKNRSHGFGDIMHDSCEPELSGVYGSGGINLCV